LNEERTKALSSSSTECEIELTLETTIAMSLRQLPSQTSTNTAIGVDDLSGATQISVILNSRHQLTISKKIIFKDGAIAVGRSAMRQPRTIFRSGNRSWQAL
jgi:hypothetical protein